MNVPEKPSADWVSIVLYFLFGSVLGCATTFFALQRSGTIYRVTDNWIYVFFAAGAAMSGALAALFGDRFFRSSSSIIPPMPIEHTVASRAVLWSIVVCSVVAPAVALQFK